MSRHLDMVQEFHRVFKLPIAYEVDLQDHDTRDLRSALIEEEWIEFRDALVAGDEAEVADAIADILYVTYGAALVFGIDIDKVMSEVHRSNMSKVWNNDEVATMRVAVAIGAFTTTRVGPDASVVYNAAGKVVKPPNWEKPDLEPLLYHGNPDEGRFERQG